MSNSSLPPLKGSPGRTNTEQTPPRNAAERRALFTRSLAGRTGASLLSDEKKPSSPPPASSQQDAKKLAKDWAKQVARYQYEPSGTVANMDEGAKRSPRAHLQRSSGQALSNSTQPNAISAHNNSSSDSAITTTTTNTTTTTTTTATTTPTKATEEENGAQKDVKTRLLSGSHGVLRKIPNSRVLNPTANAHAVSEKSRAESPISNTMDLAPKRLNASSPKSPQVRTEGRKRSASSPAQHSISSNSPTAEKSSIRSTDSSNISRSSNVKRANRENPQASLEHIKDRDVKIAGELQKAIEGQKPNKYCRAQVSLEKLLAHESKPRLITLVYKGESLSSIDAYLEESLLSLKGNTDCVLVFEALPPTPSTLSISSCGEVPKFIKQDLAGYQLEGLEDSAFIPTTTNMGYLNDCITKLSAQWEAQEELGLSKEEKTQLEVDGLELLTQMNKELIRLRPEMKRIADEMRHGDSNEKKAKKQKKSFVELYQEATTKSGREPSAHNLKKAAQALVNLQLAYAKHESIKGKAFRGDDMRLRWAQHIDTLLSQGKTVIYCGNASNSISLDIKPPAETDDDDQFVSQPPNFQTAGVIDQVTQCNQTEQMTLYFHGNVKEGASYDVASKLKFDGLGEARTVQKVISVPSTLYETQENSSAKS